MKNEGYIKQQFGKYLFHDRKGIEMSKSLIRFSEYGPGMGLPSMKTYFEATPYDGQAEIADYLRNGIKTYAATKKAVDFFTGEAIPGEYCGMTDGEFTWNSTLAYYVDRYNLRLPAEFEDHVFLQRKNE